MTDNSNRIQFIRFKCDRGHVVAYRYAVTDVEMVHCQVCGSRSVEQIEPQYIEADLTGDTTLLYTGDEE